MADPRTLLLAQSGDPRAQLNLSRQQAQTVGQSVPSQSSSELFNLGLMNLLKQAQGLGTRGFAEQEIGARETQARRILSQTPQELVGAAPSVQAGVRSAEAQALQPTISGAQESQQTFGEQIRSFGSTIQNVQSLLKNYQEQENKRRDDARVTIKDAFAIGGADSLKGLSPEELTQLEKLAGYPKGYIQGVGQTLKEREIQLRKELAALKPKRPPTGEQRQSLAFFNRASASDANARAVEESIASLGTFGSLRQKFSPDFFKTPKGKLYSQAQREFTEARLRKESGAAIPPAEFENDALTYFAQPGDTPDVIRQKRISRQRVIAGLKFSSGSAYDEFYGGTSQDEWEYIPPK